MFNDFRWEIQWGAASLFTLDVTQINAAGSEEPVDLTVYTNIFVTAKRRLSDLDADAVFRIDFTDGAVTLSGTPGRLTIQTPAVTSVPNTYVEFWTDVRAVLNNLPWSIARGIVLLTPAVGESA